MLEERCWYYQLFDGRGVSFVTLLGVYRMAKAPKDRIELR
jgi:hypothetical protein